MLIAVASFGSSGRVYTDAFAVNPWVDTDRRHGCRCRQSERESDAALANGDA